MKEIEDVRFHVFGHVHEGYGVSADDEIEGVLFVNASTVNHGDRAVNKPIMFYVKGWGREHCDGQSLWEREKCDGDGDGGWR